MSRSTYYSRISKKDMRKNRVLAQNVPNDCVFLFCDRRKREMKSVFVVLLISLLCVVSTAESSNRVSNCVIPSSRR